MPETTKEPSIKEVIEKLIDQSRTDNEYYLMLLISVLITIIGLIDDSVAIVIGGMLISPLITPILALSLGIATLDYQAIRRAISAIFNSIVFTLALSIVVTYILGVSDGYNQEILSRSEPTTYYLYIGVLSGLGATYAWIKPKISATLPGIAVSIALIPPLSVAGIGMSQFDVDLINGAFEMFLLNLIGIVVASVIVFTLKGFHKGREIEKRKIIEEEIVEQQKTQEGLKGEDEQITVEIK